MNNMLNGMFGKVAPGMCRLSMNGGIAVKTSNGYKSYNMKTGRLTNCDSFVFNIGEEFFFVIPTNKAEPGDILLVSGKTKCVIEAEKNKLTVINYEDSTVETILPERHVFMGNTYFYGKIVSMFGSDLIKGKKGSSKIMQYMMNILSQTLNYEVGNVKSIPLVFSKDRNETIEEISKKNVGLSSEDLSIYETSWDFKKHPLI